MSSGTMPKSKITMSKSMHILCLSIHIAKLTSRKIVLNYLPILNSWVRHFPLLLLLHIIYLFGYCEFFLAEASFVLYLYKKKPWSTWWEHLKISSHEQDSRTMQRKLIKLFHLISLTQNSSNTCNSLFPPVTAHLYNKPLLAAAAAAKLLQSCPTLCDPIDGSQPGSPVPGILQARTLEWVAISLF